MFGLIGVGSAFGSGGGVTSAGALGVIGIGATKRGVPTGGSGTADCSGIFTGAGAAAGGGGSCAGGGATGAAGAGGTGAAGAGTVRWGIGGSLIQHAIQRMKEADAIAVETIYDAWNDAAAQAWHRAGFAPWMVHAYRML